MYSALHGFVWSFHLAAYHILNQALVPGLKIYGKENLVGVNSYPSTVLHFAGCCAARLSHGCVVGPQTPKAQFLLIVLNHCFKIRYQAKQQTFEMTMKNVLLQKSGKGSEQVVVAALLSTGLVSYLPSASVQKQMMFLPDG